MLMRLLSAGLMAGVLAGVCVAGLQHVTTTPMILKAESFEGVASPGAGHEHSDVRLGTDPLFILAHSDKPATANSDTNAASASVWSPADGLERSLATTVTTIGAAVGFGLMLLAAMLASNAKITAATAALWGAAGFVVTGLAPGLGLAPELPGSAAADIVSRQIWWLATAVLTAVGLWTIWHKPTLPIVAGSVALIALPHIFGAPNDGAYASSVPAELAAHFTSSSLAVHAVLWVLVGALAGYFWARQPTHAAA